MRLLTLSLFLYAIALYGRLVVCCVLAPDEATLLRLRLALVLGAIMDFASGFFSRCCWCLYIAQEHTDTDRKDRAESRDLGTQQSASTVLCASSANLCALNCFCAATHRNSGEWS